MKDVNFTPWKYQKDLISKSSRLVRNLTTEQNLKKNQGYEIFEGRTEYDNGIEINCKLQSNNYVLTESNVAAKKLKAEKLKGEIVVHDFEVPGVRRFKFIPKTPYPIVEDNPDRFINIFAGSRICEHFLIGFLDRK